MKMGYQLYSAQSLCKTKEGLIDTIKKIAAMGYDGVEFCSYQGIAADEMRELLAGCNLEACNSHVQLERWEADAEGEFIYAKEAGIPCLTIPWLAPGLRTGEGYQKIKDMIPDLIALGRKYGVRLLYHNHDFEFKEDAGGNGYVLDSILSADDSVGLELDTFWAYFAGVDPVDYMEGKKSRLEMIHVKDYESLGGTVSDDGEEVPTFCAIGTGNMNNLRILSCAKALGLSWVVVEQDNSKIDVLESAELSIRGLRQY